MGLNERLSNMQDQGAVNVRRPAMHHPKGWEPGVKFDPKDQQTKTVTTVAIEEELDNEIGWRKALADMKVEVPAGYRVRLAEFKYDPVAWTRDSPAQALATTKAVWRYKFVIEPFVEQSVTSNASFLKELPRFRAPAKRYEGDSAFVLEVNDWQVHKLEGGGFDATRERLHNAFEAAAEQIKDLRKSGVKIGSLVMAGVGDIVEGCQIFPHQSYHISGDMRDQRNDGADMIVYGLDRLAQYFDDVQVFAVGGNHGQNRIDGKAVNKHDNDDLLVFEMAARELSRDRKLSHVNFAIAHDEVAMTLDVKGWGLGITHGDIYGKGTGGSVEAKARGWFRGQAANRKSPVGGVDVLLTAHFHHYATSDWGSTLWVQGPAMDGGSIQHTDLTGQYADPAMLSFVMSPEKRFSHMELLS